MKPIYLTEVRRTEENRKLRLAWTDGHAAEVEANYLRGYCPCAMCQGHSAAEIVYHRPPGPVKAESIEPVGNYAISIAWSDGHSTGIYRFDFLRRICPCDACTDGAGPSKAPVPTG